MSTVLVKQEGSVAYVQLNRPEIKNAFNEELISDLTAVFQKLSQDKNCRAVILSGTGDFFCAGGDLNWMKSFVGATAATNKADANRLATMLEKLNRFPKPVLGQVHGGAIGGGIGLVAVCDLVVAAEGTVFALAEVKLGLIPAVISPYVIAKMGTSAARRYFLTGEKFSTETALHLNLIHEVVTKDRLETRCRELIKEFLSSGPKAIHACKDLIWEVEAQSPKALSAYTTQKIAVLRASPEAQEGMKAFLEKRKPNWNVS